MKNLTEGNIYKTFLIFAIPMVLSGVLTQSYITINTIIAGKYLGDDGLAAIGAGSPFITFVSSVFWGYGSGLAVHIARLFGAGEYKRVKNTVCNFMLMSFVLILLVGIAISVFRYPILRLLKTDESIIDEAAKYLMIYILGICFTLITVNGSSILNSLGISAFPFYMSIITAILTVSGNIFTVRVLKWGVSGIAASTVSAAAVTGVFFILKLFRCFREMGVGKERIEWGFFEIKASFGVSSINMAQQMTMYVASLLISPIVNALGVAATASFAVVNKIYNFIASIYQSCASKTVSNYTAQCIGAGKYNQLRKGVKAGMLQGMLIMTPVLLCCVFAAEPVCMLFFKADSDKLAIEYAITFCRFFLPFLYLNVINNLFHGFMRGVGSMHIMLIACIIATISQVGLSFLFSKPLGMNGIYLGWILAWGIEAVYNIIAYFSGVWKRKLKQLA